MEFEIRNTELEKFLRITRGGQHNIFASGAIEVGDAKRFIEFVDAHDIEWAMVNIDSPGGLLIEGIELGRAIRDREFDTRVAGADWLETRHSTAVCASASAYAFAGGINRFFDSRTACLGIHQYYSDDNIGDFGFAQEMSAFLITYLSQMGVSAEAFVISTQAAGHEMIWLTTDEAVRLGLANNGTHPTTAEIRLAGREPYLRLEQVHHDVTARVLLAAADNTFQLFGGIVTTAEVTEMKFSGLQRTYFEFDHKEMLVSQGADNVRAVDCVLWLDRSAEHQIIETLLRSSNLDLWTENGSDFRWGAKMQIGCVINPIQEFIRNFQS